MADTNAGMAPSGSAPRHAKRELVAGRACGDCTLCCKVAAVEDFGKPNGAWCPHCAKGKRCTIYEARPQSCRDFYCQWMLEKSLGPEWKPDTAKFAMVRARGRLTALVDPGFPSAWRRSPYYENLQRWSEETRRRLPAIYIVDVLIGARSIVILPDREVDLGIIGADEMIMVSQAIGEPSGVDISKVRRGPDASV
jgi:Fe-S-cluster containining protein